MLKQIADWFHITTITSKEGVEHFKRWGIQTRFGNLYLHKISRSDEDHPHNHPWNFCSLILKGGYYEKHYSTIQPISPDTPFILEKNTPGKFLVRYLMDYHKIQLIDENVPTWTLVLTGPHKKTWGYLTPKGFLQYETYRKQKNEWL